MSYNLANRGSSLKNFYINDYFVFDSVSRVDLSIDGVAGWNLAH